jgi:hypothetical protein
MRDEHTGTNGSEHASQQPDHLNLAARIEVTNLRVKAAHEAASKALAQSRETDTTVNRIYEIVKKIATDQLESRTGIPVSWARRLMLVSLSASIGGTSAAIVIRLFHL